MWAVRVSGARSIRSVVGVCPAAKLAARGNCPNRSPALAGRGGCGPGMNNACRRCGIHVASPRVTHHSATLHSPLLPDDRRGIPHADSPCWGWMVFCSVAIKGNCCLTTTDAYTSPCFCQQNERLLFLSTDYQTQVKASFSKWRFYFYWLNLLIILVGSIKLRLVYYLLQYLFFIRPYFKDLGSKTRKIIVAYL